LGAAEPAALLDRDGLRQVSRLIEVTPAQHCDVVRQQLQRRNRKQRQQQVECRWNFDHAVAEQARFAVALVHHADVSWTASTSVVVGYIVYCAPVSGVPYTKLNTSLVSALTYADSAVRAGQNYFYVVTAVDSNGAESVFSNEATATIPTP